jgi:hypothetical protein
MSISDLGRDLRGIMLILVCFCWCLESLGNVAADTSCSTVIGLPEEEATLAPGHGT